MNVLLPTLGSAGDVHPFIALGAALEARGHRATIITTPLFQPLIEAQGLKFLPVGTLEQVRAAIAHPDLWHLRKGFEVLAQLCIPAIEEIYRLIERHADANTVVAFSTGAFGARLAQEKLGIPSASIHLQPTVIRSYADQGMFGPVRLSASHPRWFKHGLFRLVDWLVIDRFMRRPLNEFRATLSLPPVPERVMHRWMHSPQLVIAFFPEWFAPIQPDWPANTHAVGFPLWDPAGETGALREAEAFLNAGAAPVIFTPGSAGATMHRFFRESIDAARQLKLRAMLVTNYPEQIPSRLPQGMEVFGYLPFGQVLPRAALLVYHGGVGTLAQGIKAGVPHLVVPNGYDQFDSGWRIEQLGLGRSIPQSRYRARRVAAAISGILADGPSVANRRELASRVDGDLAIARACDLIEALSLQRRRPQGQ